MKKIALMFIFIIFIIFIHAQTTTINFETADDGYTASATEGSGSTDVFNRTNPNIGGNSTYIWSCEDLTLINPYIILDQINISTADLFTFSIDFLTPNTEDWDLTDELLITYKIDGGTSQNLMWVQSIPDGDAYNAPAALDLAFDGDGDAGQELPALVDDFPASVGSNFVTFTRTDISINGSTLDITLQFNNLTAAAEGIYIDNIEIIAPTISDVVAPSNFSATAVSSSQINLTWLENTNCNDVLIAWNSTNSFGSPIDGTSYANGIAIPGGGTSLGTDSNEAFIHSSLDSGTNYYYKIWSVDSSTYYSSGVTANTSTMSNYYDSATGLSGEALKSALHNIIDDHTEFTYTSTATDVWDILKETDRDPNNADNVILLYTGWSVNAAQEYNSGAGWSREHVWAKSHGDFGTTNGAGTDVHHLRPCDISVNSARGNDDFDNGGTEYIDGDGPTGCYTTPLTWEPRDVVKGDVARMIFYMAVRYEGDLDEPDLELVDYIPSSPSGEPFHAKCSTLFQWHIADPVDSWETNRNDIIYSDYQGNRNPFIDHPEYVAQIWNDDGTYLPVVLSSFSVSLSNGNPLITWSTQSESNNSHWNIFRSISQNLGQAIWLNESEMIQGQGSTSEPTDYSYIDVHPIVEFTTFYYWLESVDFSGETEIYGPVSLYIPAGGGNNGTPVIPSEYGLMQNYPNPFNPQTILSFVFQEDTQAELSVFNLKGQFIITLFQGIAPADIIQYVSWNGVDFSGKRVSSGPYFYQLKTPTKTHTKKMLLVK